MCWFDFVEWMRVSSLYSYIWLAPAPSSSSSRLGSNPCIIPIAFTRKGFNSVNSSGVRFVTYLSACIRKKTRGQTCKYDPLITPSDWRPIRIFACLTSLRSFSKDRSWTGWTRSSDALSVSAVVTEKLSITYTSSRIFEVSRKRLGRGSNASAFSFSSFRSACNFSVCQPLSHSIVWWWSNGRWLTYCQPIWTDNTTLAFAF